MPDRTTRSAALAATAVAVPVTVLAAVLLFLFIQDRTTAAPPAGRSAASAGTPVVQSTSPVTMPAPALSARATAVCRSLMSRLPPAVRDRPARKVTAGPAQNAAYGDPAITVACGAPQPRVADESLLMNMKSMVSGAGYVCWYTQQNADATVWTTVNREVPVQVTVPSAYEPAAQWANEFSDAVIAAVQPRTDVPAGCA
jgi:hypothetical protein